MIKQSITLTAFLATALTTLSQHTIRFKITSLPKYTGDSSAVYLAGSFNGWNPQDKNFRFQKDAGGKFFIETKLPDGMYEYKITRGGWDKVERKKDGADVQNRFLKLTHDTAIDIRIEEWADRFQVKPRNHTASKNVHIIDTAFLIPQLNRVRRVWIYLPPGYASSKKNYAVLYMHDGQNVFDDATSFAGEWGVDETLDSLSKMDKKYEAIVVAVDHGGPKRINEYCPYDFDTKVGGGGIQGKGEGDQYVDFLVNTLKPYIDKHYRTRKNAKNTFIAGSSMGGIISMYAVLKYPDVFGGAGVFSPAFWVGPKIFDDIITKGNKVKAKIYFYCGDKESETMVSDMQKAYDEMKKVSDSKMTTAIRPDGKHTEWVWREEFPKFYVWLFDK